MFWPFLTSISNVERSQVMSLFSPLQCLGCTVSAPQHTTVSPALLMLYLQGLVTVVN